MTIRPPACCADTCVIESDDFDRADAADPGCHWQQASGDWEIKSNKLYEDGSGGMLITRTGSPVDTPACHAWVECLDTSSANKYRIAVNVVDASNYAFAEYDCGSGYLRVGTVAGGAETILHSYDIVHESGADYTLSVCRSYTGIYAGLAINGVPISTTAWYCIPDNKGRGAGIVNVNAQAAYFDDFLFTQHTYDYEGENSLCGDCACECDRRCLPKSLTLTINSSCGFRDGIEIGLTADDSELPHFIWHGSATIPHWDGTTTNEVEFWLYCPTGPSGATCWPDWGLCVSGYFEECSDPGLTDWCTDPYGGRGDCSSSHTCDPLEINFGSYSCYGSGPPAPPPGCTETLTITE